MSLRLFAALTPPPDIADRLAELAKRLDGWHPQPPENLHVTLAFFGDVSEPVAEDLHEALAAIEVDAFDYWIDGVDAFGGGKPRIAFARVRPDPALKRLRDKVRLAARDAGIGLKAERYVPHVTLGRGGGLADARFARWLEAGAALLAGPIRAEQFELYRSDLGRGAPVYSELSAYKLGK